MHLGLGFRAFRALLFGGVLRFEVGFRSLVRVCNISQVSKHLIDIRAQGLNNYQCDFGGSDYNGPQNPINFQGRDTVVEV